MDALPVMTPYMSPTPAILLDALLYGLGNVIHIVPVAESDDVVARLKLGRRPVLYLDVGCSTDEQCSAVIDALRALTLGPEEAESAKWVRHLRLVS